MASIVVAGALACRPDAGGHAWVFLQYLLGFRRLGFDVLFVDRLPGNVEYLDDVMRRFGVPYAVVAGDGGASPPSGLPREALLERVASSALLLNVNGYVDDAEVLDAARLRVFLDIDPGFLQIWRDLGLADVFGGHDAYVTVGANIGRDGCAVPTCGLDWIRTPPPVVLDEWRAQPAADGAFTSVASWRGAYGPIEYGGRTYGLRVHEFRKLLELPRLTGRRFELALAIDEADEADRARLVENGWGLVDPQALAADVDGYRDYVQASAAEIMVAKNIYVDTRSGWFSDRSPCYLASGRPVLAQDTGFSDLYPVGDGLLAFSTLEEAAAGVEAIVSDYDRHARSAREIAEAYFDSDVVLTRLLAELGI